MRDWDPITTRHLELRQQRACDHTGWRTCDTILIRCQVLDPRQQQPQQRPLSDRQSQWPLLAIPFSHQACPCTHPLDTTPASARTTPYCMDDSRVMEVCIDFCPEFLVNIGKRGDDEQEEQEEEGEEQQEKRRKKIRWMAAHSK